MKAREDQLPGFVCIFGLFQVDKAPQDVEPVVTLEHSFPKIAGAIAIGVGGIACTLIVAQVEGQKARDCAFELGCHVDFVAADGKVHQRTTVEGEQWFFLAGGWVFGQAVILILANGVVYRLREISLELKCGDGNAVDKEHEVDAVLVVQAIVYLAHHSTAHLCIALRELWIETVAGFELAKGETSVAILEAVAQEREWTFVFQ